MRTIYNQVFREENSQLDYKIKKLIVLELYSIDVFIYFASIHDHIIVKQKKKTCTYMLAVTSLMRIALFQGVWTDTKKYQGCNAIIWGDLSLFSL